MITNKREAQYNTLERVQSWIMNCDTKSSLVLGITGVILTIIFTSSTFEQFFGGTIKLKLCWSCISARGILLALTYISFWLYIFFTFRIIYFVFRTLIARTSIIDFKEPGLVNDSQLFFGTIGKNTYAQYQAKDSAYTDADFDKDMLSQILINSKIANEKD